MPTRRNPIPNFVLSTVAREGHGKTNLLLSATRPLEVINIDPNTDAVVKKLKLDRDPDVTIHSFDLPSVAFMAKDDVKAEATRTWEAIIDTLYPIVQGKRRPGTVAFDTASEFDSLNILAAFGKEDQISPDLRRNQMGPINRRFKGVIEALARSGCNVILAHRARDKYEEKEVRGFNNKLETQNRRMTGLFDMERLGFKGVGNLTSVEVFLAYDREGEGSVADRFGMFIDRCTLRPALIGREYFGTDPDTQSHVCSFPYIATLVYPDTQLEDWY